MAKRAPTPCRYPGCAAVLGTPGYCDRHRVAAHRDYGRARRGFDAEVGFYQSARWRTVRAAFLREHPLCGVCAARGRVVPAVVVDHALPLLVRTYQKEVERQRLIIRKAEFTQQRLMFFVGALRQLLEDEHFTTLLRAEGLDTLPQYLAERVWSGGQPA